MKYGSVCSGIEAATQAWHPLGWQPAFFSEIDKFASAVLAHRYGSNMPGEELPVSGVPNLGDMSKFREWQDYAIDLLVGGTPCQSFSIAGFRDGLDDPRGNLMLTYLAIARRYRPRWLVWENVPGVLSSWSGDKPPGSLAEGEEWTGTETNDFGTFLHALSELGYHAAWRVLDAQFVRVDGFPRAVPQRRRRLFVVCYLGDWRRPAAVLFEWESLQGHSAPRRKAQQETTIHLFKGPSRSHATGTALNEGGLREVLAFGGGNTSGPVDVAATLTAHGQRIDFEVETFVVERLPVSAGGQEGAHIWSIRRLTPNECERLQGFPDDFTRIPWRGKGAELCPEGLRFKALGNSMPVNVMRWIGRRIEMVEKVGGKSNGD